ncbi:MAG: glutamate 5-kinase [Rhodospirillaceae bacterium]|nr:glutamate 5-kinase [Rhodospirillaceae bacterium]MBT4940619.1 glutamate 5-kinase [Rhodospirillaceae bacterium]MBT5938783.1 glutamate 5-kinase [Rhodospirillaceae bacterium]MBT7266481.1 glutamate 5-kinase [Rhodospirillaceae bacterium]
MSNDLATLQDAKRIVVKIGSVLLVDGETGRLHRNWLEALAGDIERCRKRGQEVIIVSSGAIALGRRYLGFKSGDLRLEEKQAAAAAGMVRLTHAYQECFEPHDLSVAQILLTRDDSENRRRYLNARSTLMTLLEVGAVPLINENDTVATDEIRFGDNDRLAARVAAMVSADVLVLLSDIDGLYDADPTKNSGAKLISEILEITPEIEKMAGAAASGDSSGGMVTKLAAAKQCLGAGCSMVITKGEQLNPLQALEDGANCSWFRPSGNPQTARKQWIAGTLQPHGTIVVDQGAVKALKDGRSLLPAGVASIDGEFERGDAIAIKTADGHEIGRGLSAYSSDDARLIMGHKTGDILALLGYRGRDEMVHRDDLVMN